MGCFTELMLTLLLTVFVSTHIRPTVCARNAESKRIVSSSDMPSTNFSCSGRPTGYYADTQTGCQVYHMCAEGGRQFSYRCPSKTLFQQRMLICAHWYQVNCSRSEFDYDANLLIGQRDKPFVSDAEHKHFNYRKRLTNYVAQHTNPTAAYGRDVTPLPNRSTDKTLDASRFEEPSQPLLSNVNTTVHKNRKTDYSSKETHQVYDKGLPLESRESLLSKRPPVGTIGRQTEKTTQQEISVTLKMLSEPEFNFLRSEAEYSQSPVSAIFAPAQEKTRTNMILQNVSTFRSATGKTKVKLQDINILTDGFIPPVNYTGVQNSSNNKSNNNNNKNKNKNYNNDNNNNNNNNNSNSFYITDKGNLTEGKYSHMNNFENKETLFRELSMELQPPHYKPNEDSYKIELFFKDPRGDFFIAQNGSHTVNAAPVLVTIHLNKSLHESPILFRNQHFCARCHPLFVVNRDSCIPCVVLR